MIALFSLSMEFQIEGPKKTDVKSTIVCSGIKKIVRLFCCKSSIFVLDIGYYSEAGMKCSR